MRTVKELISTAVLLVLFVLAVSLLAEYFRLYTNAYQGLSRMISHASIGAWVEEGEE